MGKPKHPNKQSSTKQGLPRAQSARTLLYGESTPERSGKSIRQQAPQNSEALKPYISASQLTLYETCGEAYRRRYIEGERIPPGMAAHKGSGVHGGAQYNFTQKIDTHKDLPIDDIIEVAITSFEKRLNSDDVLLLPEEVEQGRKVIIGKTKDAVSRLTTLLAEEVAPKYQPILVEQKQKILLPKSSHDLVCILDLADDKDRVVDFKTGTKKKPKGMADESEQLTFQALTFKAHTGRMPSEITLECLIDKKVPENQTLTTTRNMAHIEGLIARINTMQAGIEAGIYIPTTADNWKCSPRWCGYFQTCPYTKGRR